MTHNETDFSLFDRPEILQFVFYPRKVFPVASPPGASDRFIEVAPGIKIGCRFYTKEKAAPTILFFHGNGEVAIDYDPLAPLFHQAGANLFVADYRGYGQSNGEPTISAMMHDAHVIFREFMSLLGAEGYSGSVFLMGRSLGSASAVELAYHYQDELKGLIIESGFADLKRLFLHLGFYHPGSGVEAVMDNASKVEKVRIPTLILHAENDSLIPLEHALTMYQRSGASDKRLAVIPGAEHNNIMIADIDLYFRELGEFIRAYA